VSSSLSQPEIAQAVAPFERIPKVAIDPAPITGNSFPLPHSSHDLTFCFEVVNARDIIIPEFISRAKDDIIQLATRQSSIHNDLSYDSDDSDESEEIFSDDSTHEDVGDNEDSRGLGMRLPYKFLDIATFEKLMQKLELSLDGFNVKVDLDEGFLNVRTVPGIAHGTASGAFLAPVSRWAENDQPFSANGIDVLINSMDTSILLSVG
jgi:hypothetical protein